MTTTEVLEHFGPRFPFFTRDMLYNLVRRHVIACNRLPRPTKGGLPLRDFPPDEVLKLEKHLEKLAKKTRVEAQQHTVQRSVERERSSEPALERHAVPPLVLIVEPMDGNFLLIDRALRGRFQPFRVATSERALVELSERGLPFDAVLVTDAKLPSRMGMEGTFEETLRVVRTAQQRGVPCAVCSISELDASEIESFEESGAQVHIVDLRPAPFCRLVDSLLAAGARTRSKAESLTF